MRIVLVVLVALATACDPITRFHGRVLFTTTQAVAERGHAFSVSAAQFPQPPSARPGCLPRANDPPRAIAVGLADGDELRFDFEDLGVHEWQFIATLDQGALVCLSQPVTGRGGDRNVQLTCELASSCPTTAH